MSSDDAQDRELSVSSPAMIRSFQNGHERDAELTLSGKMMRRTNQMRQSRSSGSLEGIMGNHDSYADSTLPHFLADSDD
jgi:hypothetical protein